MGEEEREEEEEKEEVKYERCGGEEVWKCGSGKIRDCPASSRSVIKDGRGGETSKQEKSKKYELCKRYDMTKWDIRKEQKEGRAYLLLSFTGDKV